MPRRPRVSTSGLVFHALNRGAKKSRLFESDEDYRSFEEILIAAVARFEIALFAYCLMPNHWHFVISPRADGALSRFMHWLTTTHARRWQAVREMDGQGAVYQGRFKAIPISSDRHFLWVCRYVERNAVRASIVGRSEEWMWSSLWRRSHDEDPAWLSRWPVPEPPDWLTHVNVPQTAAELEVFRQAIVKGEPYGDEDWCHSAMIRLGAVPRRKRGRPRRTTMVDCPQKMTPTPFTD